MNIKVRKATKQDAEVILDHVVELAIYEKEPDAVTADQKDYEEGIESGLYQCLMAEDGDEVLGVAIYYPRFSTWKGKMMHLEDFVVRQAHRRKGIGKILFDAFLEDAKNQDCRLAIWQVLDWNEPAIKFYEKERAVIDKEWWNCKIYF